MKLYRIDNEIGSYYVIAEHPTHAEQKLQTILDRADYGYTKQRVMKSITLIAESIDDERFISGKFLVC
jgi:hypothetical protein